MKCHSLDTCSVIWPSCLRYWPSFLHNIHILKSCQTPLRTSTIVLSPPCFEVYMNCICALRYHLLKRQHPSSSKNFFRATSTAYSWPKHGNFSAEMPQICNYKTKIKNKESYDQLTLTRQNSGGIRRRRTRADEKCVECEVQSGASGAGDIWMEKR